MNTIFESIPLPAQACLVPKAILLDANVSVHANALGAFCDFHSVPIKTINEK
jgi:hypothetical protein